MKEFKEPNTSFGWKCPICKTNDNKPVVLIGIHGTEDGNNMEAEQFHTECIDLAYYKNGNILAMKIKE